MEIERETVRRVPLVVANVDRNTANGFMIRNSKIVIKDAEVQHAGRVHDSKTKSSLGPREPMRTQFVIDHGRLNHHVLKDSTHKL